MSFTQIIEQFFLDIRQTSWLEFVAVIFGIVSVWYSRKENILVYPIGLVNTIPYIFISINGSLYGEASVNLYYTIMNIYGWILWAKKNQQQEHIVVITWSDKRNGYTKYYFLRRSIL